MKYNDGYKVDDNMRVIECPKCENEIFSGDAVYCKLCGTRLFNECEGEPEYNYNGELIDTHYHKNLGDARYCETCGQPTCFLKEGFLKSWEEAKKYIEELDTMDSWVLDEDVAATTEDLTTPSYDIDNDDDIPF